MKHSINVKNETYVYTTPDTVDQAVKAYGSKFLLELIAKGVGASLRSLATSKVKQGLDPEQVQQCLNEWTPRDRTAEANKKKLAKLLKQMTPEDVRGVVEEAKKGGLN